MVRSILESKRSFLDDNESDDSDNDNENSMKILKVAIILWFRQ